MFDPAQLSRRADELGVDLGTDYLDRVVTLLEGGSGLSAAFGLAYQEHLAREQRRRSGIFYTPEVVAEQVVGDTLDPILGRLPVERVLAARVVDLACGGGVFPLLAAERMRRHCHQHDPAGVLAIGGDPGLRRALLGTLVAIDIDPRAAAVTRLALSMWACGAEVPDGAVRVGDGLDTEVEEVSAVIGNPPWGQKGFLIGAERRAWLRTRFQCARGPLDPFKLFVERAIELASPGARIGLVLPDIILLKNQEPVRRLLLRTTEITELTHLGRIFDGVNLDAVSLVCTRVESPAPSHQVAIRDRLPGDGDGLRYQRQSLWGELPGAKFNLYMGGDTLALYRHLRGFSRLEQYFEIHEGVHTGNCRDRLFVRERPSGPHAEVIVGKGELAPFSLQWAGTFLDLAPGIIDKSQGRYANLGQRRWHDARKLLIRRTGDRIVAARDTRGYHASNNMLLAVPLEPMDERELAAFLGLVGSSLYTWFFRTEQPRVGRLFAELKVHHLRSFPVPDPAAWRAAVPELAELTSQLERGEGDVSSLDERVMSLFELDEAARRIVRGRIGP